MLPYGLFNFRRTRCSVSTGQPVHFHRTVHNWTLIGDVFAYGPDALSQSYFGIIHWQYGAHRDAELFGFIVAMLIFAAGFYAWRRMLAWCKRQAFPAWQSPAGRQARAVFIAAVF